MSAAKHLKIIGPGILVAATGVGAGDLATASFAGATLGLAVLWAVAVGAFLKFVLNEGLTRWQLATGSTLLEGSIEHLWRPLRWFFLIYLLIWSFCVAAALMSAIGVTAHAILPLMGGGLEGAQRDKVLYGLTHSFLAVVLIHVGGYRLFEKVMSVCIVVMFVVIVTTAIAFGAPLAEFFRGLFVPTIPRGGIPWTIAILGGVGGTVTMLCYGYWIREEGRAGPDSLAACRIDLGCGYFMTALFGLAMIVVGSKLGPMEGGGATVMVKIAEQLQTAFGGAGTFAKWAFLAGAWGAVFSSLLGVWQSVPYLFADLWQLAGEGGKRGATVDTAGRPYRSYLYAIATIPILGVILVEFREVQKLYAITGALFVPMLAAVLLALNGPSRFVGPKFQNSWATNCILGGALALFAVAGFVEIREALSGP